MHGQVWGVSGSAIIGPFPYATSATHPPDHHWRDASGEGAGAGIGRHPSWRSGARVSHDLIAVPSVTGADQWLSR